MCQPGHSDFGSTQPTKKIGPKVAFLVVRKAPHMWKEIETDLQNLTTIIGNKFIQP